jgi:hypothetical protein
VSDGTWYTKKGPGWIRITGVDIALNYKWVVALYLTEDAGLWSLKAKTLDGTVWQITQGSQDAMNLLIEQITG